MSLCKRLETNFESNREFRPSQKGKGVEHRENLAP